MAENASVPAVQAGNIFRAAIQDVSQSARSVLQPGESLTVDLEISMSNLQVAKNKKGVRLFQRKTSTNTSSLNIRLATRLVIEST